MVFMINHTSILLPGKIVFIGQLIIFILCITVLFYYNDNSQAPMYYTNVTRFHKQGRFDFLNTTFCGKFIANKWNLSINDTLIHQQNEYLKIFTCLSNVYVTNQSIEVNWGTLGVLQVERLCQSILLKKSSKWHYHMNIAGSELPIQTNLNRIQILNLVQDKSRNDVSSYHQLYSRQKSKKTPPPYNVTIYKGEFHSILTREFIQASHTHPLALELWSYLNGTKVPDEQFTSTLVRIADFPGGKARIVPEYGHEQLLSHYKLWIHQKDAHCESRQYSRSICQFNYKDLSNIEQSGRLFANKFNQDNDLVGIDYWEQWFNIKQTYPFDIHSENYINKYPFVTFNIS